jgi:hypothetical protein
MVLGDIQGRQHQPISIISITTNSTRIWLKTGVFKYWYFSNIVPFFPHYTDQNHTKNSQSNIHLINWANMQSQLINPSIHIWQAQMS